MKEAFSDMVLHSTSPAPPGRSSICVAAVYRSHTLMALAGKVRRESVARWLGVLRTVYIM